MRKVGGTKYLEDLGGSHSDSVIPGLRGESAAIEERRVREMEASATLKFNYGHIAMPKKSPKSSSVYDGQSTVETEDADVESPEMMGASAFARAEGAAPDPILSMRDAFLADPVADKLNVAVGVYRTADNKPLVLESVQEAEAALLSEQQAGHTFKEYLPPEGMAPLCAASLKLLLGDTIASPLAEGRLVSAQSLSGTGGLHLAARMLSALLPGATVHLPSPTWPIHPDIFTTCGLRVASYPYYDASTCGLNFDAMIAALCALPVGSIVLLHACAHNPTGVDPTAEQWDEIARAVESRRLIPLVDAAYQGFASGDVDEDAVGARKLAAIPNAEMVVVQSYSKNMGLYAERVGVLSMLCNDPSVAERLRSQLARTIRLTHSSPPQHGAAIVTKILNDPERARKWRAEVAGMARRLQEMRSELHAALERLGCPPPTGTTLTSWDHVLSQRGMFTYSGLQPRQVEALRVEHHVYMPMDGRISMASLTRASCQTLATAIDRVLRAASAPAENLKRPREP